MQPIDPNFPHFFLFFIPPGTGYCGSLGTIATSIPEIVVLLAYLMRWKQKIQKLQKKLTNTPLPRPWHHDP